MAARRSSTVKGGAQATAARADTTADGIERQVVAFAEQLGRIVGTVQAKTEGWLDPQALTEQLSRVRDNATSLLEQLGATRLAHAAESPQPAATGAGPSDGGAPSPSATRGRSGGVVDAPGKKHRKPTVNQPLRASAASAGRVARMKAVNANRRRGRG